MRWDETWCFSRPTLSSNNISFLNSHLPVYVRTEVSQKVDSFHITFSVRARVNCLRILTLLVYMWSSSTSTKLLRTLPLSSSWTTLVIVHSDWFIQQTCACDHNQYLDYYLVIMKSQNGYAGQGSMCLNPWFKYIFFSCISLRFRHITQGYCDSSWIFVSALWGEFFEETK